MGEIEVKCNSANSRGKQSDYILVVIIFIVSHYKLDSDSP